MNMCVLGYRKQCTYRLGFLNCRSYQGCFEDTGHMFSWMLNFLGNVRQYSDYQGLSSSKGQQSRLVNKLTVPTWMK